MRSQRLTSKILWTIALAVFAGTLFGVFDMALIVGVLLVIAFCFWLLWRSEAERARSI